MAQAYLSWARLSLPTALVLTGQAGAAAAGSVRPGTTLVGQSAASASYNSFFAGASRGYLSFTQLQIPEGSGASQALTGQTVAASAGTLLGAATRGYLSWARIVLPPSTSPLLVGLSAAASAGSVTAAQGAVQGLTGIAATCSSGSPSASKGPTLTGSAITAAAGTLRGSEETMIFAGLCVPSVSAVLLGSAMGSGLGSLGQSIDGAQVQPLSGQFASTGLNTPTLDLAARLIGFGMTLNRGTLGALPTPQLSTPSLVTGTSQLSIGVAVALTSQALAAGAGTFFAGEVVLAGVEATATAGAMTTAGWNDVPPPSGVWTNINASSPTWTNV